MVRSKRQFDLCGALVADAEKAARSRDRRLCIEAAQRIAELEAALRTIASTFDETWLNGSIERQAGDLARAALQPKPTKE